jgi:hypothetical protein
MGPLLNKGQERVEMWINKRMLFNSDSKETWSLGVFDPSESTGMVRSRKFCHLGGLSSYS